MHVVPLRKAASKDTVETLETLLRLAKRGRIAGLVYGYQEDTRSAPVVGLTGRYRQDEFVGLGVVSYMVREYHAQIVEKMSAR